MRQSTEGFSTAEAGRQRRLVIAAGSDRLLSEAAGWLREQVAGRGDDGPNGGREVLMLASTGGAAAELVRQATGEASGGQPAGDTTDPEAAGGLLGVHRYTLYQLAARVMASAAAEGLAEAGLTPLTSLAASAVSARCVARSADRLDHFAPVAAAPGFVRLLPGTLFELRSHGVSADLLTATGPAGRDLARLLTAFEEELAERRLIDIPQLLRQAAEALRGVDSTAGGVDSTAGGIDGAGGADLPFPAGLPLLLLDLPPTTPAERELLAALVAGAPAVLATALAGDREGAAALERLLAVESETLDRPEAVPRERLERLRRYVFEREVPVPLLLDPGDVSVDLLAAPGEGRECVELARAIRDQAARGVPFDRMALLLRAPEAYLPLVEEALARADIPAYFSRGVVRPLPAGRAFLSLLACAAEGLTASRFAEYLSLGQVPPLTDEGEPPEPEIPWVLPQGDELQLPLELVPPAEEEEEEAEQPSVLPQPRYWERLLVDAAVVGGADRWRRRLAGLEAEVEAQLAEAEEETARRRLAKRLEELQSLARFALPLIEELAELPDEAPWRRWIEQLGRLAGRSLVQPRPVLAVLAELAPMADVGPVALAEVRQALGERLTTLRTPPLKRRHGRLFVGAIHEARGRSFTAVFLPGLAEGIFPRRAAEDSLLLDDARRQLAAAGAAELPTQDDRVARERLLLSIAIGAASDRLVASYPSLDVAAGRPRVPSFYALDLLRAAEGQLPDLEALEKRAALAAAAPAGWPAPRRPEQAVDDGEYDLAILEPLLHRGSDGPGQDEPGAGHYLLEVNDCLARSLRGRWMRWHRRFHPADGLVDPQLESRQLLADLLGERRFSATALESFAACPYRFLLKAIHRLRPRETVTPLARLDPATRGRLFHQVQQRLFEQLDDADLLPMLPERREEVLDRLDRVLDEVAAEYRERLAPSVPRVWASEIEALRSDLRGWVRAVAAVNGEAAQQVGAGGDGGHGGDEGDEGDGGEKSAAGVGRELAAALGRGEPAVWRPIHWELSVGAGTPIEVAGLKVHGRIDLIEEESPGGRLRVTDHKTGAAREERSLTVGGGEVLQPLLYAAMAEEALGRPAAEGALFYCTQRGGYRRLPVTVDESARRQLDRVLTTVAAAVADGFLPALPRKDACAHCDYRLVCGPYEEDRTARKRPKRGGEHADRFDELVKLREMP